jgi:EAL domain-containing protein (putative c-di-GMP-specific phosphodiesterase class I)
VRAVVGLGRGLGLSVIGEGVERLDELEFLKAEKCPEAQGYFFGRPQPIAAYRHLTHAHDDIVWDDSAEAAAALA